jgi:hypothetical protein
MMRQECFGSNHGVRTGYTRDPEVVLVLSAAVLSAAVLELEQRRNA